MVKNILRNTLQSVQDRRYYLGQRNPRQDEGIIGHNTPEEAMIANKMERNVGFRYTTDLVNEYRTKHNLIHVSVSAVIHKFKQMNPTVTKIKKLNQGNKEHKAWIDARYNQSEQFCVMLGRITKADLEK